MIIYYDKTSGQIYSLDYNDNPGEDTIEGYTMWKQCEHKVITEAPPNKKLHEFLFNGETFDLKLNT